MSAWREGARTADALATATRATTGCGGCRDAVCGLVDWLSAQESPDQPAPAGGPESPESPGVPAGESDESDESSQQNPVPVLA